MPKPVRNSVVLYHATDLDGKACGVIGHEYLSRKGVMPHPVGWAYDTDLREKKILQVGGFEEIIIGDLSFTEHTRDQLEWLCGQAEQVLWFDHHEVSIPLFQNLPASNIQACVQTDRCGAYLLYQGLFPGEIVPQALVLIDDYDRWVHNFPESRALNAAIAAAGDFNVGSKDGPGDQLRRAIFRLPAFETYQGPEVLLDLTNSGYHELRKQADLNRKLCRRFLFRGVLRLKSTTVPCLGIVLSQGCNSDLFDGYDQEILLVSVNFDGDRWQYSLYSRDPEALHVGKLALEMGGGGHPGAAGFMSKEFLFVDTVKVESSN